MGLQLDTYWQTRNLVANILSPLSVLFCLLVQGRQTAYRTGWLQSRSLLVPVIIVGNITVGGTGKTPFVIWLARYLSSQGLRPGVLTRGYKGKATNWPQEVTPTSNPDYVGDEAVVLARRCGCPVIAGPHRFISGSLLIKEYDCNIVVCDDGLQHYALQRNLEIAIVDGMRRLGNGLCLPAGPLREPAKRLNSCDLVIVNGESQPEELGMKLQAKYALNLRPPHEKRILTDFQGQQLIAIAGIGHPERFFAMLEAQGIQVKKHAFPDHHPYSAEDCAKFSMNTVLMTEKDGVKCERFANAGQFWYIPVEAIVDPNLEAKLATKLEPYL